MREAKLGVTPADRRALKFEVEVLEEHPVGDVQSGERMPIFLDEERIKRIANGPF